MRCLLAAFALVIPLAAAAGQTDPRLADAQRAFDTARSLWQTGNLAGIDLLLRHSLRLREEVLGTEDLLVAETRDHLGRNAFNGRHFVEAERLFRDAARIAVPKTGEKTEAVAYYYGSIGASLREQGLYDPAWPYVCRSLEIRRELQLGDWLIASSLDNMARIAFGQGRHDVARSLLEQSHWTYLAVAGPDAPVTRSQDVLLDRLRTLARNAPRVDARDLCRSAAIS